MIRSQKCVCLPASSLVFYAMLPLKTQTTMRSMSNQMYFKMDLISLLNVGVFIINTITIWI